MSQYKYFVKVMQEVYFLWMKGGTKNEKKNQKG